VGCLSEVEWLALPLDRRVADAMAASAQMETGAFSNPYTARADGGVPGPNKSSASGRWQLTDDTWKGYVRRFGVTFYPRAFMAPPAIQESVVRQAFTEILRKHPSNIHALPIIWFKGSLGSYPAVMNEVPPGKQAKYIKTYGSYALRWAAIVRCDDKRRRYIELDSGADPGVSPASTVSPAVVKSKLPICLGFRGDDVLVLNELFGLPEGSPNVFGSALQFHILAFQLSEKLPTTGCYDAATAAAKVSSFSLVDGSSFGDAGAVVAKKMVWNGVVPKASQGLRQDLKGQSAGVSHISGEGLVFIGQGNHKLARGVVESFWQAEFDLGGPIWITDSYRSAAVQADVASRKPGLALPQGRSLHERGRAVDLNTNMGAEWIAQARRVLVANKWTTIRTEIWHVEQRSR
jgi:hypothetical protein